MEIAADRSLVVNACGGVVPQAFTGWGRRVGEKVRFATLEASRCVALPALGGAPASTKWMQATRDADYPPSKLDVALEATATLIKADVGIEAAGAAPRNHSESPRGRIDGSDPRSRTSSRCLVVRRRRIVRFHFLLLLELRALEAMKSLLDFLYALRKGLHNLIEIAEQLLLKSHPCLELDDAFFHGEIVTAPSAAKG